MYKKAVEIKPGNLLMYMESKWGYRIDPRYFYDAEQYRNILADNPALGWALTGLAMYERSVGRNDERAPCSSVHFPMTGRLHRSY